MVGDHDDHNQHDRDDERHQTTTFLILIEPSTRTLLYDLIIVNGVGQIYQNNALLS